MAEDAPKGFLQAQKLSVEYLKDFAEKIFKCADVNEYYELVTSVLVFQKLVKAQFKELYEIDDANSEKMLADLDVIAGVISEEVLRSVEEERKKDMN
jgi:hypothetical protein